MGDAAHATTPWQGYGAAQAIENALILQSLFKSVSSTSNISEAFKAYDTIRRPRALMIIESSKEKGLMFTGQVELTGLDA